jgi:hypothetical protein
LIGAAYWLQRPPDSRYAAIIFGVVAILMTVRTEPQRIERAASILLVVILMIVQVESVRGESRTESRNRQEENTKFETILKANQEVIQKAKTILDTTRDVGKLARQSLANITGGNSFAYVYPGGTGPHIPLLVGNSGDNILTGVSFRIEKTADPDLTPQMNNSILIGTIAPYGIAYSPISISPVPDPKWGVDSYFILVYAQNGMVSENLKFRQSTKDAHALAYAISLARVTFVVRAGKLVPQSKNLANTGWIPDEHEPPPQIIFVQPGPYQ